VETLKILLDARLSTIANVTLLAQVSCSFSFHIVMPISNQDTAGDLIHYCGAGEKLTLYEWTGTPLYTWQKPANTGRYEVSIDAWPSFASLNLFFIHSSSSVDW
jgi:hypothetical protein